MPIHFKLYVGGIFGESGKGNFGVTTNIHTVLKNMDIVFSPSDAEKLKQEAIEKPDGISLMHRFCQFIVYVVLRNDLKYGNMAFFDCENNMDIALDMHLRFTEMGYEKLVKEDFMREFLELQPIYEKVKGMAELIIEDV